MGIRRHYSLAVAEVIVAMLEADYDFQQLNSKETNHEFRLECYQNGREQGYGIVHEYFESETGKNYTHGFLFAQYRTSDSIVIYEGTYLPNQAVSTEMWETKTIFGEGQYSEVVEYLVDKFKNAEELAE